MPFKFDKTMILHFHDKALVDDLLKRFNSQDKYKAVNDLIINYIKRGIKVDRNRNDRGELEPSNEEKRELLKEANKVTEMLDKDEIRGGDLS